MRQRNAQFANKARAGKNPVKPSRQDRLAKRSPISLWALGAILFVIVGGGTCWLFILSPTELIIPCYSTLRIPQANVLVIHFGRLKEE